jgi:hypothetical protein
MTTKYTAICAARCVSVSPRMLAPGQTHNIEYDRLSIYVLSTSGSEEEEGGQDGPGHTSAGTASAPPSASTSGSAATETWRGRVAASVGAQNVVVVVCSRERAGRCRRRQRAAAALRNASCSTSERARVRIPGRHARTCPPCHFITCRVGAYIPWVLDLARAHQSVSGISSTDLSWHECVVSLPVYIQSPVRTISQLGPATKLLLAPCSRL